MMFRFGTALVLLSIVVYAIAIPVSLLNDVKQAEIMAHSRLSNKVKRAQEVIMFGNQQNRAADGRGFSLPRADKRGVEVDENSLSDVATENPLSLLPPGPIYTSDAENGLEEPKTMAQYEKVFAQVNGEPSYAQQLQNSILKSELYSDPAALSDIVYDMESRRKRDARAFRTPVKRSRKLTSSRAKRDLEIDPEEFLALLSLWESERRNKAHETRNAWPRYKTVDANDFDISEGPDDINEIDDDDDSQNGAWLDGPAAVPSHHIGGDQWDRQRFPEDRRKRFMVSKRRQDGGMYSLAQLLNGPRREPGVPLYHRLVL